MRSFLFIQLCMVTVLLLGRSHAALAASEGAGDHKIDQISDTAAIKQHSEASELKKNGDLRFFSATDSRIRYVGRIDFSNPGLPRWWNPGIYLSLYFTGNMCKIIVQDQVQYGVQHNYIEIVLDGKAKRIRLNHLTDTLAVHAEKSSNSHHLEICKDTESNIGYISIAGILCPSLAPNKDVQNGKRYLIECFGDSITCGASSDLSDVGCGEGRWEDQHNCYMSYGPSLARLLHSDWLITAVSGIGLIHSCCGLKITLPQVYNKLALSADSIQWNFQKYQPDLATICLGQNDGIQDLNQFCSAYIDFIDHLRQHYPKTTFVLLTSPMADSGLAVFQQKALLRVQQRLQVKGEHNTYHYFFKNCYHGGCDGHPTIQQHQQIAAELYPFLQKILTAQNTHSTAHT